MPPLVPEYRRYAQEIERYYMSARDAGFFEDVAWECLHRARSYAEHHGMTRIEAIALAREWLYEAAPSTQPLDTERKSY